MHLHKIQRSTQLQSSSATKSRLDVLSDLWTSIDRPCSQCVGAPPAMFSQYDKDGRICPRAAVLTTQQRRKLCVWNGSLHSLPRPMFKNSHPIVDLKTLGADFLTSHNEQSIACFTMDFELRCQAPGVIVCPVEVRVEPGVGGLCVWTPLRWECRLVCRLVLCVCLTDRNIVTVQQDIGCFTRLVVTSWHSTIHATVCH